MLEKYGLIETKAKAVKIGDFFGRLEVLAVGQVPFTYRYKAICVCKCGKCVSVRFDALLSGVTTSCGCYQKERSFIHGGSKNGHVGRWRHMMNRCYDTQDAAYKNYGGRGIFVCDRWHDSINYISDILDGYFKGAELDRIDNNKGYSPENTRWTTRKENCRNRRTNRNITFNNETKCVAEWSELTGIPLNVIYDRLNSGWSNKDALTKPVAGVLENILMAQKKRWEGHVKKEKPPKHITKKFEYLGSMFSIKELSEISGVSRKLLRKRIAERNWSVERAVMNENFKGSNQYSASKD